MNSDQPHCSDELLIRLMNSHDENQATLDSAEYVDRCRDCQTRLEQLAAEAEVEHLQAKVGLQRTEALLKIYLQSGDGFKNLTEDNPKK